MRYLRGFCILAVIIICVVAAMGATALPTYTDEEKIYYLIYNFPGFEMAPIPVYAGTTFKHGLELDIDPDDADWEGYCVEWRFADGTAVEYPYTVSGADATEDKIIFYGAKVPVDITITVIAGDEQETLSGKYGETPTLPESVFNYSVRKWYTDEQFHSEYILSPLKNSVTLYPTFIERKIKVTVDLNLPTGGKIEQSIDYGSAPENLQDTDTHRFVGFRHNGDIFQNKIVKPVNLTAHFERLRYRVTVIGDATENLYFDLPFDNLSKEHLAEYGNSFSVSSDHTNPISFPYPITDDITLYAFSDEPGIFDTPNPPEEPEKYTIAIESEHAAIDAASLGQAGSLITVNVKSVDDGYVFSGAVISCDGESVPAAIDGAAIKFIMPQGDVTVIINCQLNESASTSDTDNRIKLSTKEITAVSLTSVAVVGVGVILIIKKLRDRKKSIPRKEK